MVCMRVYAYIHQHIVQVEKISAQGLYKTCIVNLQELTMSHLSVFLHMYSLSILLKLLKMIN